MSIERRYTKGWKDLRADRPRSFRVRAQYAAEELMKKANAFMGFAFQLSNLQAEMMNAAKSFQEDAKSLSRMSQAEAMREKNKKES